MTTTFAALGVPADIARALANRGITEPFPIQEATVPDGLAGRDLSGKAPTGSGKTIAFGIPLVARVTRAAPKRPKGLVLVPTRELALQVADELRNFSGDLRVLAAYGGAGIEPQIKQLRQGVDILVACPGRLLDLIDRNTCDLRDVSFAVIDEADRMADMGFLPDVRRILDQTRKDRQTVLFSATLDGAVDKLVREYQTNPVVHETAGEESGDVEHHFWIVDRSDKVAQTAQVVALAGHTIVFCRTRHGSDRVAKQLGNAGVKAAAIHGARSQAQRERALRAFHNGEIQALVATDVAARGIHVEGVLCVVHFDLPADHKDYTHRSGRTARAGNDGTVVVLVEPSQRKDAVKLRKAAGVPGEITSPDVSVLPVAAPFVARRGGAPGARPARNDKPKRSSRYETTPSTSRPRAERTDTDRARTDRPRTERPRVERTDTDRSRDERPRSASASAAPTRTEHPRTERPQAERPQAERPERSQRTAPSGRDDQGLPTGDPRVRPSGAARRKAKRQAAIDSGEAAPSSAKRKRSGAPRPPKAKSGSSSGSGAR